MSEHELRVVVEAIGWTLVHFLWQGALIAGALALALLATRGRPARERYLLRLAALGAMALAPALTFAWLRPEAAVASAAPGALGATAQAAGWSLDQPLPWVVLLWLSGVAFFALRLAGGAWQVLRLPRRLGAEPLPPEWRRSFERVARELGVRARARLVRGARVTVPTVVGWVRPVVLLPARVFYGLTEQQVEALIAHELAHVARFDPLVNLAQSVVETLLFYHPAVWWVSRGIRAEREFCCDDLAVAVCRDGLSYARALAVLEGWRGASPQPGVSTLGGELMQRIQRLVGRGDVPPARPRPARALGAVLALGALGSTAFALSALPAAGAVHDCKCSCHARARASDPRSNVRLDAPEGQGFVLRADGGNVLVERAGGGEWVAEAPERESRASRHRVNLGEHGELEFLVVEEQETPHRVHVDRALPDGRWNVVRRGAAPEDEQVVVEELAPGRYEVQVVGPSSGRAPHVQRIEVPGRLDVRAPKVEVLVAPHWDVRAPQPERGNVYVERAPFPQRENVLHEVHEDAPRDAVLHEHLQQLLHQHLQQALHEHMQETGAAAAPDVDVEALHRHLMETLHQHLQQQRGAQDVHDPHGNVYFAPAPEADAPFGAVHDGDLRFGPAPVRSVRSPFGEAPEGSTGSPFGPGGVDSPRSGRVFRPGRDPADEDAQEPGEVRGALIGGNVVRGLRFREAPRAGRLQ